MAGLAAGLFLTLFMIVVSAVNGRDIWYGMKGAGAPFLGDRAMRAGYDFFAVSLGLLCHLVVSIGWAIPFAMLFYGLGRAATLVASAAWGILVWIGMYDVVLPLVGLSAMTHEVPVGRAITFHVIFSLTMGVVFLLYERAEQREQLRVRAHAF